MTSEKQVELLRKENEHLKHENINLKKIIQSTDLQLCKKKMKTAEEFIKRNSEVIQKNIEIKNKYQALVKETLRIKKNLESEYKKLMKHTIDSL